MLKLLDFFTSLDDIVSDLRNTDLVNSFHRLANYVVQGSQSRSRYDTAFEQALVSHLQNSFGRHVGSTSCLLALAHNILKHGDYLLIHLLHWQDWSVFLKFFLVSLLVQNALQLINICIV